MQITRMAVLALRITLVGAFGLLLVFQFFSMPGQFAYMAEQNPNDAHLRWPLTIFAGALILCAQIVIVSTWKLLTMVEQDRIFSTASFRWVDAILGAIGTAWTMWLAAFFLVGFRSDDPGAPMLMLLILVGGTVLGLLMIVMRALLQKATMLRTDMEGVI